MTWVVLISVIVGLVYVGRIIRIQDQKSHLSQLHQTTELWAEAFNLRLISDIDRLSQMALPLSTRTDYTANLGTFHDIARTLMIDRAEILEIALINTNNRIIVSYVSPRPFGDITMRKNQKYDRTETKSAVEKARRVGTASFSDPYALPIEGSPFIDLIVPVHFDNQNFLLVSRISLWVLLRETSINNPEYRVSLYFEKHPIIAASTNNHRDLIHARVPLRPLSSDFQLEVSRYAEGLLTQNTLFWVITALGIFLVIALLGIIRFNWRQNRIEEALRAESALRKNIADSQLSGLQVTDISGRIIYTNKTLNDLLGLKNDHSLIGQIPPYSYWPKGDQGFRLMELLNGVKRGQLNNTSYEFPAVRADGQSFWVLLHIVPMLTVEGEQIGWLWTLTDISEIRQAQEKLSAAHERFNRVLESMLDPVSVVDPKTNALLFSNSSYDKAFGEDAIGHISASKKLANLSAKEKSRSPYIYMEELERWFSVRSRMIPWTDRTEAELQILTDITEQRRNEMLLAEQQARSELNSRLVSMGEMASSLAHELNQPLSAISNYAFVVESLMIKAGVPEDHEMLYSIKRIESQTKRAGGIIKRIRSFTRRSDPKMELIAVSTLVNEVMELANIQARRHNASLDYFIAPDVDKVYCDEIMIEQVLLNLIKNGIEAAASIEGNKPIVTLTIYRNANDYLVFEVADNGTGIKDEDKEHLFDPFFTTKSAGMGMGLNICRTIVELHHGRLCISNNLCQGSIFTLSLPTRKTISS